VCGGGGVASRAAGSDTCSWTNRPQSGNLTTEINISNVKLTNKSERKIKLRIL